ncbi:MAG: hypothetical protein GY810_30415 [Aureispira sp.]|nr:hypothetical protein [Aureispira sp.]
MGVLFGIIKLIIVVLVIFGIIQSFILPSLKHLRPYRPFLRCPVCKERGSLLKTKDPDQQQADKHEILDYDLTHNDFYIYTCQSCKNEVKL